MEIEGTRGSRPYAMAQKLNGWKQLARSNYHQGTQFVAEPRYNYFLAAGRLVPVPNAVMQRQNILPVPVLLGKKTGDVEEEMKIKLSRMVGGSMHRFLPSPSSAEEEKSFLQKKNCLPLRFLQFGKKSLSLLNFLQCPPPHLISCAIFIVRSDKTPPLFQTAHYKKSKKENFAQKFFHNGSSF